MSAGVEISRELARAVDLQMELTDRWHQTNVSIADAADTDSDPGGIADANSPVLLLIRQHHRANFDLWHEEDRARDPGSSDAEIASVKRAIDRHNQTRNDLVEQIDERLAAAAREPPPGADLHSETPGAMLDRLSILALKLFHTRLEAERSDGGAAHRARNHDRLTVLLQQHSDLRECLLELWTGVAEGRRRFKVYRQLKMYNDPELNPVLYRRRSAPADIDGKS